MIKTALLSGAGLDSGGTFVREKAYIMGSTVEVRRYLRGVLTGDSFPRPSRQFRPRIPRPRSVSSVSRTRVSLRRLLASNEAVFRVMLTLTFRDGVLADYTSLDEAHAYFRAFLRRYDRLYGRPLRYVAVPEFQDKKGRGAVHYHVICDMPFIPHTSLLALWGAGFVRTSFIRSPRGLSAYLSKYISKGSSDVRLYSRRAYFASWTSLQRPVICYNEAVAFLLALYRRQLKKDPSRSFGFSAQYVGRIEVDFYSYSP